jgi:hypothetical protein
VISNGYKPAGYLKRIVALNAKGFKNLICVLDNKEKPTSWMLSIIKPEDWYSPGDH